MVVSSLLGRDLAQVDPSDYSPIASFFDVHVIPLGDEFGMPVFATKTMARAHGDEEFELQHCLYVSLNQDACDSVEGCALQAHTMYEDVDGTLYVDASYKVELGVLNLQQYFFLPVDDCEFFVHVGDSTLLPISVSDLWQTGKLKTTP